MLLFYYYVYCYHSTPEHQGKLLICETLLVSQPDSESLITERNFPAYLESPAAFLVMSNIKKPAVMMKH